MGVYKSIAAASMAAIVFFSGSAAAQSPFFNNFAAKLPTIQGTYTPPNGVDWGCGKGKKVTVKGDGSRVCPVAPYKGGK